MSRFDDLSFDAIAKRAGWKDASVLTLYSWFLNERNLMDEFTDFCRTKAEEELTDDERLEDEQAAWEEAGGPICPQCGVTYTGVWNLSHKMDCSIGRTPLDKLRDVAGYLPMGAYRDRAQRYLDKVSFKEAE